MTSCTTTTEPNVRAADDKIDDDVDVLPKTLKEFKATFHKKTFSEEKIGERRSNEFSLEEYNDMIRICRNWDQPDSEARKRFRRENKRGYGIVQKYYAAPAEDGDEAASPDNSCWQLRQKASKKNGGGTLMVPRTSIFDIIQACHIKMGHHHTKKSSASQATHDVLSLTYANITHQQVKQFVELCPICNGFLQDENDNSKNNIKKRKTAATLPYSSAYNNNNNNSNNKRLKLTRDCFPYIRTITPSNRDINRFYQIHPSVYYQYMDDTIDEFMRQESINITDHFPTIVVNESSMKYHQPQITCDDPLCSPTIDVGLRVIKLASKSVTYEVGFFSSSQSQSSSASVGSDDHDDSDNNNMLLAQGKIMHIYVNDMEEQLTINIDPQVRQVLVKLVLR